MTDKIGVGGYPPHSKIMPKTTIKININKLATHFVNHASVEKIYSIDNLSLWEIIQYQSIKHLYHAD